MTGKSVKSMLIHGPRVVQTVNRTAVDITSEAEITSVTALTVPRAGRYSVVIAASCNATAAGCILTIRVEYVTSGTTYEVYYDDDVDVSGGASEVHKSSKDFDVHADGTVKAYITSDDAGDNSESITAMLVMVS